MKVSIYGLGYIGLPTAAIIASKNINILGIDINKKIVSNINKGKTHIKEKNLSKLLQNAVEKNFLSASLKPEKADVHIIAVPTPIKSSNLPDLSFVNEVLESISKVLKKEDLIIIESTCPVGTTEKAVKYLKRKRKDLIFPDSFEDNKHNVYIVYCPERVLPGNILFELQNNNRVLGGTSKKCTLKAQEFYKNFVLGKLFLTNSKLAEMTKLTENSFRDVNIAFANEISQICDKFKIDVWELIKLANEHPRVNILEPGPGVGGHCIAVDPWFLIKSAKTNTKLIEASRYINSNRPKYVYHEIIKTIKKSKLNINKINICCLGITFKPDVDDIRTSPALEIVQKLDRLNFKNICVVEPNLKLNSTELFKNAKFTNMEIGIKKSDVVIILVNHKEFKSIKKDSLINKILINTKGRKL